MLNGIAVSQYNPYQSYAAYGAQAARGAAQAAVPAAQAAAIPAAQPETPVQPVTPVRPAAPVQSGAMDKTNLLLRWENDPAAMATRNRIRYAGDLQAQEAAAAGEKSGAQSVQEAAAEAECQTCKERKYQDGSDDPGVSFKTASHIDPNQAASVVRGHEQEHVVREQAKAAREDREVVSQSVTLHTGICPECGKAYVSGGTTRTVTRASQDNAAQEEIPAAEEGREAA
ncbi:MAG: hypothetical protein HFG09_05965 [Oscillibacter sp.]|nr:hypothetical protein [Oscillibacter sp.]